MRVATYNVEWFSNLFSDDGALLHDGRWSARHDVTRADQLDAVGRVIGALEADAVLIVEAPDISRKRDGVAALERFAKRYDLRPRAAIAGFASETQQELILLYDPDKLGGVHAPGESTEAPRFDGEFEIDLDIDASADRVRWSKPPLELELESKAARVQMIGVHAKSKAPHGATDEHDAMRIAIANRRKQLAQCIWLRRRVEGHLAAGTPLLVMGDFNDGPGLDRFEALFGRSGVEIVLGGDAPETRLYDPHAAMALQSRIAAQPTTARFYQKRTGGYLEALLDYIMVSPGLRPADQAWRIWHPFNDPGCWNDKGLRDALLTASDHFPVTLDIG